LFRPRRFSSEEELGRGFHHRVHIEPVGAVEVGQRAGLAEAVDAERADLVPSTPPSS
jgi:hypothetical protein